MTEIIKKKSLKKVAPIAKPRNRKTSKIDAQERHNRISEAAYYIAEKRGFEGLSTHDDWFSAETEIDEMNKNAK
jgi:hypothetical protein